MQEHSPHVRLDLLVTPIRVEGALVCGSQASRRPVQRVRLLESLGRRHRPIDRDLFRRRPISHASTIAPIYFFASSEPPAAEPEPSLPLLSPSPE